MLKTILLAAFFPVIGAFICVIYPLVEDFNKVTSTECNNFNVFPSVSAAISNSIYSSIFWFLCIALHTPLRFKIASFAKNAYEEIQIEFKEKKPNAESVSQFLIRIAYQFNNAEIIGLFLLSTFNSISYYELHKLGFIIYLICSFSYSLLVCYIEKNLQKNLMHNIYKLRLRLTKIYMCSLVVAVITFIWHNKYCTSYVYSVFGLSEMVLILSNIAFHCSSYFLMEYKKKQFEKNMI